MTSPLHKSALLASLFLCVCITIGYSQKEEIDSTRYFYKPEWESKLARTPKDQKKWQDFELHARMYAKYAVPEEKVVPIVINIVNSDGKKKISSSDITSQLATLNDAFAGRLEGKLLPQFEKVRAGDTKIRFCLGAPTDNKSGVYYADKIGKYSID